MSYPQDLSDLSREEKIEYYKTLSQMTSQERRKERNDRFSEMISENGMKPSEAVTILDGEEMEARELLRDEKMREKRMEKEGKSTWDIKEEWTPEERVAGMRQRPLTEEEKRNWVPSKPIEEEITKPEPSDFLNMKEKVEEEQNEYISDLEKKEKQKEILSGLTGFGSREPLKEAIVSGVVSGAKKLGEFLKGKPKTREDIRREEELKEAAHKARVRATRMGRTVSAPRRESGEPSIRDLGKGSLGTERYERPFIPDFFGGGFGSGKSPIGEPIRRRESRPPSTDIPFGGSRAPSTSIPMGGSRPPSTSFPGRAGLPETRVQFREKAPSTRVPIVKEKPPKTSYRGANKVSTRIPKGERKAPVILKKAGKPISTKIGKPQKIKTRVQQVQQDAVDILGLRGFF